MTLRSVSTSDHLSPQPTRPLLLKRPAAQEAMKTGSTEYALKTRDRALHRLVGTDTV